MIWQRKIKLLVRYWFEKVVSPWSSFIQLMLYTTVCRMVTSRRMQTISRPYVNYLSPLCKLSRKPYVNYYLHLWQDVPSPYVNYPTWWEEHHLWTFSQWTISLLTVCVNTVCGKNWIWPCWKWIPIFLFVAPYNLYFEARTTQFQTKGIIFLRSPPYFMNFLSWWYRQKSFVCWFA